MKNFIVFLALLYTVDGQNLYRNQDQFNSEYYNYQRIQNRGNRQRIKPRQSYYIPEPNYSYNIDYLRFQDERLTNIEKRLEELLWYMHKKEPQQTQPQQQFIYVPYSVPYPILYSVPHYVNIPNCEHSKPTVPNVPPKPDNSDKKFEEKNNTEDEDIGTDEPKPVSFDEFEPEESIPNTPPVEHGSTQVGMETETDSQSSKLGMCHAAIVLCCDLKTNYERKNCFSKYECIKTFETGQSCSSDVVKKVTEEYEKAYALNGK